MRKTKKKSTTSASVSVSQNDTAPTQRLKQADSTASSSTTDLPQKSSSNISDSDFYGIITGRTYEIPSFDESTGAGAVPSFDSGGVGGGRGGGPFSSASSSLRRSASSGSLGTDHAPAAECAGTGVTFEQNQKEGMATPMGKEDGGAIITASDTSRPGMAPARGLLTKSQ